VFQPDLATSLNTLPTLLGDLGGREEALTGIEEILTIWRELAARWRGAYDHQLEQSSRVVA
jgi:hypothetical protein